MPNAKRDNLGLPRRWCWLTPTGVLGVLAVVGLMSAMLRANEVDFLTGVVLALIVVFWVVFQWSSWWWQHRLVSPPPLPDIPADDLLTVLPTVAESDDGAISGLVEGAAERIVDEAMQAYAAPGWLSLGSTTLISLGLAGTFLGLTLGLFNALPHLETSDVELAIRNLLDGAKLAFVKSLAGIVLAMLWNFRFLEVRRVEKDRHAWLLKKLKEAHPTLSPERILIMNNESLLTELRVLRGDDGATLAALVEQTRELKDTMMDLGDALPERIGSVAGTQMGVTLQPKLDDLTKVLQALGSTGKDAIGEAFKNNMGDEVSELRQALLNVTAAMVSLPVQIARGSQAAAGTLTKASQTGATEISKAASEVAGLTRDAGSTVEDLKQALTQTQGLVMQLQSGSETLSRSFDDISRPLQALPGSLESVRTGIEQAGEHLTTAGAQAGQSMKDGGIHLAGQVENAGNILRDGVASEFVLIRDSLRAQREAEQEAKQAWVAERAAIDAGASAARERLVELQTQAAEFRDSVDGLRQSCADTIDKLHTVAGTQQAGADDAIAGLLRAVDAFSDALESNKAAIQAAGLQSVASTEQVTAVAARQVADALTAGAEGLADAMARAEKLGQAMADHAANLDQSLGSASSSAHALQESGAALVSSSAKLKEELEGVSVPLIEVRGGLEKVVPAVDSAARSMGDERRALSGLGEALKEQADLIRKQETALQARTQELRRLHEVLGQQWSGHIGRMSEAHEQVKSAWQEAMRAATEGLDKNATTIGAYAKKVEASLGLSGQVTGLQESLSDVADTLGDLTPVLKELGQLTPALKDLAKEISYMKDSLKGLAEADG